MVKDVDFLDSANQKYSPSGNLVSTDAQAAFDELEAGKIDAAGSEFKSYVGFAVVGSTAISAGGTTNINFSLSNIHKLTGTGATGIGSFTFPSANGKYSLIIPSSVDITAFSTAGKVTYGASPDLSSGASRFLAIHWDGTNAHCFVSRQGTW